MPEGGRPGHLRVCPPFFIELIFQFWIYSKSILIIMITLISNQEIQQGLGRLKHKRSPDSAFAPLKKIFLCACQPWRLFYSISRVRQTSKTHFKINVQISKKQRVKYSREILKKLIKVYRASVPVNSKVSTDFGKNVQGSMKPPGPPVKYPREILEKLKQGCQILKSRKC